MGLRLPAGELPEHGCMAVLTTGFALPRALRGDHASGGFFGCVLHGIILPCHGVSNLAGFDRGGIAEASRTHSSRMVTAVETGCPRFTCGGRRRITQATCTTVRAA